MSAIGRDVSRRELLQLAVAPLLCACRSQTANEPITTIASETPEKPPMTTEPKNPDAPADAPPSREPFRLDDQVKGGELMASEPGPRGRPLNIHEWTSWLRVRSDERVGVLVQTRREGDLVGQPVGYYRRELDERQLATLQRSIESIKWSELPALRGGDVLANHYALDYHRGSLLIQRQFNAKNFEFIAAISPYMEAASEIMSFIAERPVGLVKASVLARSDPRDPAQVELRLVLENPGSGSVVLTDPRIPAPKALGPTSLERGQRVYLRVAPDPGPSSWSEPNWTRLPIPALPDGEPATVILPPGGRFEIALSWRATAPGLHVLRGEWFDYGGPVEPVEQLPFIPLAEEGTTPPMQRPYPVRGAAFALGVNFEIPR